MGCDPRRLARLVCGTVERHPGLTRLLERACPFLAAAAGGPGGAVLLLRVHALAVGIAQLADPPPVVAAVLAEPGMEVFRVDPGPMLEETLVSLLSGLEQLRTRSGP